MRLKKFWKRMAIFTALMCVTVAWGNVALAESSEESVQNVSTEEQTNMSGPISSEESSEVMPLDITVGDGTWYVLQKAATAYLAPYGTGCAPAGKSFSAGQGVYVVSRDYEYYYVYWYDSNGKEMFAYLPMSAFGTVNYIWTEYDIYEKATCTATTEVVAYAGTTNTYAHVGWIYAGESPLMVLGQRVNPYNNVTYYFVQYETDAGLAKRGWVDASLGTVSFSGSSGSTLYNDKTESYYIVNRATGLCLGWSSATNGLNFTSMNGLPHQAFKIMNVKNSNGRNNGYYQIVPASNPGLALRVSGTGYANGLSIDIAEKSNMDKRQEFRLKIWHSTNNTEGELRFYTTFATRSTGEHRSLNIVNGALVQSTTNYTDNSQMWEIYKEQDVWEGTYGRYGGNAHPGDFKFHVDSSVLSELSMSEIQDCLDQWNDQDERFSIQAVNGGEFSFNRLATFADISFDEMNDDRFDGAVGIMAPEFRNEDGFFEEEFNPNNSQLNGDWYSTKIYIDFGRIRDSFWSDDEYKRDAMITLIHEIGHALKLSHTFRHLSVKDIDAAGSQSIDWFETTVSLSLMNTVSSASGYDYLMPIDIRRFVNKWENVQ